MKNASSFVFIKIQKEMMDLVFGEIKELMDERAHLYNQKAFISNDPISIPHQFEMKEDIEISGFLTATISWGQRTSIIRTANELMDRMDRAPFDFIINHDDEERNDFKDFVYRTFNGVDMVFYLKSLQNIYKNKGGIHAIFSANHSFADTNLEHGIRAFRKVFFELEHEHRTEKHFSDISKNSAAKRMNMFLRWMVRADDKGVDFGLWKDLNASQLLCPLDTHSGRVARAFGLLERKQNDWQAVIELTENLKKMDSQDPVKYDFALFGMGVNEEALPIA
ncbi:MAG: TIGR02757 family protein [Bacteroidota bacterium]